MEQLSRRNGKDVIRRLDLKSRKSAHLRSPGHKRSEWRISCSPVQSVALWFVSSPLGVSAFNMSRLSRRRRRKLPEELMTTHVIYRQRNISHTFQPTRIWKLFFTSPCRRYAEGRGPRLVGRAGKRDAECALGVGRGARRRVGRGAVGE